MPWRYFGHAHADPNAPTAAGICDRCNFTYQLSQLQFQHQYMGEGLQNLWLRVCSKCLDVPSVFLKAIKLPSDPEPVKFPRPNQFEQQSNSVQLTQWDPPPTYPSIYPPEETVILGYWDDGVSVWG